MFRALDIWTATTVVRLAERMLAGRHHDPEQDAAAARAAVDHYYENGS